MRVLKRFYVSCLAAILIAAFSATAHAQYTGPRIFLSDLQSGPNTNGQSNQGAFVTIYGKGFGSTRGTSSVTVGGGPAYRYLIWSDTKIAFQIGNQAASGKIVVKVGGVYSNGLTFTVRAGHIRFVSTSGSDSFSGSYSYPWRTLTKAKATISAGDIVYAMTGVTATSADANGASLAITRTGSSGWPMAIVAYPGATVTVGSSTGQTYGIRGSAGASYWVFAGLTIRGLVEAVDLSNAYNWRLVGNNISCPNGSGTGACINARAAGGAKLLGNNIHDTGLATSSNLSNYEAVSFSSSNSVELGWNSIANTRGCRAVLFYTSTAYQHGLAVHDNLIRETRCDAISFASADPSAGTVRASNNIIVRAGTGPTPGGTGGLAPTYTCVSIAGSGLGQARVLDNTLYDCGAQGGAKSGSLSAATPVGISDNIVYAMTGENYVAPSTTTAYLSGSNNLFYGALAGTPAPFTSSVEEDPQFVNPASLDFHLQSNSPAINAGTNTGISKDYDGVPRPQGTAYDIGALEFNGVTTTGAIGQITENPTTLNFGTVAVGASSSLSVQVSNTGTANATISQTTTTGSGFSVAPITLPMTLAPGQITTLVVTFAPTVGGTATGSVVLTSNASDPTSSVQLTGAATTSAGTLAANTTGLSFGTVTIGSSKTQSVTVTAGNSTVTISQASITGTGAAAYSVSGLMLPATVATGQSVTFQVKFAPTNGGSFPATLSLASNASNSPATVTLTGNGAHAVVLSWTASTSSGVTGYNVYRSTTTTSGGPYTKITASSVGGTSYTDATVTAGITYYYVVTAVASGIESSYSSQVTAAVPTP